MIRPGKVLRILPLELSESRKTKRTKPTQNTMKTKPIFCPPPTHRSSRWARLAACGLALTMAALPSLATDKLPTIRIACTAKPINSPHWQPAIADGLAEMMATELGKMTDKFQVLETLDTADLLGEIGDGEKGFVAEGERVQKGHWLGADYALIIKITRFAAKEDTYGGGTGWLPRPSLPIPGLGGGSAKVRVSEHEIQLDWRIVDIATRAVVPGAQGRATGKKKGMGMGFHSYGRGGFNMNNSEFADSALGKASMEAIAQVVEQIKPLKIGPGKRTVISDAKAATAATAMKTVKGTVKLVDGKEVWVSLGANRGFAVGDQIKIYRPVEKRNKKGEVVATDYKEAGQVTLEKVQAETSMGRFEGSGAAEEEWVAAAANVDVNKL